MLSFQGLYTRVQNLISDSSANSLTLIKALVNDTQGYLLTFRKDFTETSATDTTVASQQNYKLPYNYGKMFSVTVTVGSVAYPVEALEDDQAWFDLNARSTGQTSDIPQFFYVFNDQLYLYPTPASASNTITMYYHKLVRDMVAADYTTGTIVTATNASAAITGATTVWTVPMQGRFFRITNADAAGSGDGYWYEILTRDSATTLTLKKKYQGTSIAAGAAAYTIGEMPIIPEGFHELLVWRPVAIMKQQSEDKEGARMYWRMFDGGYSTGDAPKPGGFFQKFIEDRGAKTQSAIIQGGAPSLRNPNNHPLNLTG